MLRLAALPLVLQQSVKNLHAPNDLELNCNYSLCRHGPPTKPSDRFLCFLATAVVIALPACVKIISTREGNGFTCFAGMGGGLISNLVLFSLGLPNLWLQDSFLFRDNLLSSKECRPGNRSSQIKGRWTARGSFDIKQGAWWVGGYGERNWSLSSLY